MFKAKKYVTINVNTFGFTIPITICVKISSLNIDYDIETNFI